MFASTAYALAPAPQGGADAGFMASISGFMPILLIIVIFYFFMIRPQQKKAKAHQEMLRSLKKGDAVITNGGMYGRIVEFQDDIAAVDLGEHTVFILRGALTVLSPNQKSPLPPLKEKMKKKKSAARADDEAALKETEDKKEDKEE
ncbi:MAG: preprotein translocase subunit YajC [Deltaproteobacteria bacterium]|jgi:preprotein translocase subunit YajC|nr:preprotein translocase subunit YajC [Deltaproteobacteria bacterium]